jgi:hypothetical protein
MRSKRNVGLVVVTGMVLLFTAGAVWRVLRPSEEDRVVRDLPVYPGSREAGVPATDPSRWRAFGSGFSRAVVISYSLPSGTSRDDVLRFYREHMPASFRREGSICYARGDARVLLVTALPRRPTLDVAVATNDAECP